MRPIPLQQVLTKKNIQLGIVIIGSIALLYLLGQQFMPKQSSGTHMQSGQTLKSISQLFSDFDGYVRLLADKEINDSLERVMQEKLKEGWERNPFEVLVSTTTVVAAPIVEQNKVIAQPTFIISGIIAGTTANDSSVIINGEFYKIGDTVDGWTIAKIEPETVIFRSSETEYIYNLYEQQSMMGASQTAPKKK